MNPTLFAVDENGELYGAVLPLNQKSQGFTDSLTDPTPSKHKSFAKAEQNEGKASRETDKKGKSKVPPVDEFATNAMIWAYSTKTEIGEQKIFYRKNKWALLEKTNDGFVELGQYNSNHYDFINEEVNKHNEELYNPRIDERIYSSIMHYENIGINDSRNYGNDVGQQTSNGRIGEVHQEQSESNRSGDGQSRSQDQQKYSRELDAEYLSAVERGDMATAQQMVYDAANKAGYVIEDYKDAHAAPLANIEKEDFTDIEKLQELADEGYDTNLFAVAQGISIQPDDYFSANGPRWYMYDDAVGMQAYRNLRKAMNSITNQIEQYGEVREMPMITVYRAVPNSIKEGYLQSGGQWVSPSKQYAINHGEARFGEGEYRIIEETVSAENLWWDGNDIREWGYDDGANYGYKNTKNNRKLLDPVTYDDDGNVIPLSERFNAESNDIRYSRELDVLDYITPEGELEGVDEMAFSNRELLANALLDTVTSSAEYKLIRSYQEEIAGLDKSDKRLQQLKKDRAQLYKQKNPNFEVIGELNEKIKALEGEIVKRDKRLLRLESTTALKKIKTFLCEKRQKTLKKL